MYPCVHNEVVMGQRGAMRDFLRVCKDMPISTICHAGDIIMYFIFLHYNIHTIFLITGFCLRLISYGYLIMIRYNHFSNRLICLTFITRILIYIDVSLMYNIRTDVVHS